jgi:hypothetical protein
MFKAFDFCIPTRATKVPAGEDWLHGPVCPLSNRMLRMRGFCPADLTKNFFRTRRGHPETGIAQYTQQWCIRGFK